jgi:hypothetical protein
MSVHSLYYENLFASATSILQPTHLDFIHVADCMIKLDRASLNVALLAWQSGHTA